MKILLATCLVAASAGLAQQVVSDREAGAWVQHLTPLPRQISIPASLKLKPSEIKIVGNGSAGMVADQALLEMKKLFGGATESAGEGAFTITFQIGGPEAEPLKSLKNADQAYLIQPQKNNKGLSVIALGERGLYYGGKTLQQLIRPRLAPRSVEIPLATVLDWPEMETRGLWGGDSFQMLPFMADRKLNYEENISWMTVNPNTKRGRAAVKPGTEDLLTLGPRLGIEHAPVLLHLEILEGKGIFEVYPEFRAKGGVKPGVLCYSQPGLAGLLADWIADLGSQQNVQRVDVWMTENLPPNGGCKCDQCKGKDWVLEEARTIIAAWKEALKRKPDLKLRVLTSEATYSKNPAVFALIPREVGIWYYHSLLTYTARKTPMIEPPILREVKSGRWMGVCPSLVAHVGVTQPFTSADFIHYRMHEFTSKGLSGMIGYAVPRTIMNRFHVEAAAEWLWNPEGRTPRDFAFTWAVREKIRDPEKFAAWHETISPVEWAIYGSEWPGAEKRTAQPSVAQLLAKAKLPELGIFRGERFGSPWGEFKSPEQLKGAASAAKQGVKLAREIGIPELLQESLVIQGYADSLCALWELKQVVTRNGIASANLAAAQKEFANYERALEQSRVALRRWNNAVSPEGSKGGHVGRTVDILQKMSKEMKGTAGVLGME